MKLGFIKNAFVTVQNVLRPVLDSLSGDRQSPGDRIDSGSHIGIGPIRRHRHAVADAEFVFEHGVSPEEWGGAKAPTIWSAQLKIGCEVLPCRPASSS